MEKIWYTSINGKKEGPFSGEELFFNPKVNLNTLVWKEGLEQWTPIYQISELTALFNELENEKIENEAEEEEEEEETAKEKIKPQDELVLELNQDPNFLLFWVFVIFILIIVTVYYYI